MAMRLGGSSPLVHIVPAFSTHLETLDAGGPWQVPHRLLAHSAATSFPGTSKVTRAPLAYLRQMQAYSVPAGLIVLDGPVVEYEVALTDEEAAIGAGTKLWMMQHKLLPIIKSAATLGLYKYSPRVVMRVTIPAAISEMMQLGILKASQEKTDPGGVASTPVHTRLEAEYMRNKKIKLGPGASTNVFGAHKAAMHFIACMLAEGRAVIAAAAGDFEVHMPDNDPDEELDEAIEKNCTGVVIPCRETSAPERPLRDGVSVRSKTEEEKQEELEKKIRRPDQMPFADETPLRVMTESIGPPLVECRAPMNHESEHNERVGVTRHLAAGTRPPYTDEAKNRFAIAIAIAKDAILTEFTRKEMFKDLKMPNAWSDTLKEATLESAPFDRMYRLCGFVKPGEIGLDVKKRPRLIGNPGPYEAGAQAETISIFEQCFCQAFPGFMCKGLTLEQLDKKFEGILRYNAAHNRRVASCDFSAMDSSWSPEEKQAVKSLVLDCSSAVIDAVSGLSQGQDPTDFPEIKWRLKEIIVEIEKDDMILFSGERGTSIYNRLLVLLLRTAEVYKFRGDTAAKHMWEHARRYCPRSEGDLDVGDGDDTAFDARDYANEGEIQQAYLKYGKTIEPVISSTALEVLSRYFFLSSGGKFYALVKPGKNIERCLYARRTTTRVEDGVAVTPLTPADHAEFATAAYQRAIAAKHTPVVRRIALAVGDYQKKKAESGGAHDCVYDSDIMRRNPDIAVSKSLNELAASARDAVVNAHCNGFVMEHWIHFPFGATTSLPRGALMGARAADWLHADEFTAEAVISDDDMLNPSDYFSRCEITPHIAAAIGVVNPTLLKCCFAGTCPPTTARPDRSAGVGKHGCSRPQGGRSSESGRLSTANSGAHSRRAAQARSGPSGRSTIRGVATSEKTDGTAMVPRL